MDSSTAARELSPGLPPKSAPAAQNHGRRRSLDLAGARPLAKKAVSGGGLEAGPAPPDDDDDDDKRKAVHTGRVSHASQSVQDHRGDWRGEDTAAATAAPRNGSAMRRRSDITPIRRSSLTQALSDTMQAQGQGRDSDDGKPHSLRARGQHRRASHDVSHRRASHDGSERRASLTASLFPNLAARRVLPASAAEEKKPSCPPAKYQATRSSAMYTVCTCSCMLPRTSTCTSTFVHLYQAALFDLLFGTRGDGSVNVASLYSVVDEEGNTALTTAWQRVTCEDGQELIRQGDDKSEWCGDLTAEVEPPLGRGCNPMWCRLW